MAGTALDPGSVTRELIAAIDRVAALDVDQFEEAEATTLLTGLVTMTNRLGGEIARIAAHVGRTEEWKASGATSLAAHMSNTTGIAWGQAKASIKLGDALTECPALDEAVRSGELSPAAAAKVLPALSDDGFEHVASELIAEVAGLTPTKAERHIETWRAVENPLDDEQRRRNANDQRTLTFRSVGDGMTHIDGIVPNRIAQSLRRSLKHLADQQRLDESDRTTDQRRVDALGDLASACERGEVTGGRNLPRIIASMTLGDLEERAGIARGTFGETITSSEIQQLCCDANIHRAVTDQTGAILEFGRGKRTISPHQYLALVARDGGCRHPGCDRPPEWCEGHHINEYAAHGGNTNLDELALLCHHHHHNIHDRSWSLTGTPQHLVFTGPDGRQHHSYLAGQTQRPAA